MKTEKKTLWFVVGSQHLYGEETLKQVAEHAEKIVAGLNGSPKIRRDVVLKPVVTTSDQIYRTIIEAGADQGCIGIITWMHTFSPAKMWIKGLKNLTKPMLHLHTQYNREIPWDRIDMDFMNLNQSAHGGREFGYINTRLGVSRKVVTGYWQDENVQQQVADWISVAEAVDESRNMKVARFGDNMRDVAVTEGNKVSSQIDFEYEVHGYGIGDLTASIDNVTEDDISAKVDEYNERYVMSDELKSSGAAYASLTEALKIEAGLENFLVAGGFKAFTTTFENLYGMKQLPGTAVQNLMAKGYGFGAEGDWKTAALLRTMKVMGEAKGQASDRNGAAPAGTSFMEDYTYHFDGENSLVLGAHMLEVCPSIAGGDVRAEVHPLGIGGKEDPVRLVFDVPAGRALNATMIDLGSRFRLVVNELEVVEPPAAAGTFGKLPVARALWKPMPNLETSANAWIYAGGAHHSVFSQSVTSDQLRTYADIYGVEVVVIDKDTKLTNFRNELRWNEAYYR
ncbi:MAG: L-arabinose isomerase [Spirochaetales bacterium]|uniref:L-arabinose isomerase n=1 Tax=Candidatus Thalassospirochaeta sargassi TaxID=3119039 RepID=A0AAJ1IH29_9SPIO|nr:L-arabinose isomerase [Spirochaetales bacterium]